MSEKLVPTMYAGHIRPVKPNEIEILTSYFLMVVVVVVDAVILWLFLSNSIFDNANQLMIFGEERRGRRAESE